MDMQLTTPGIVMIITSVVSAVLMVISWRKRQMPGGMWFFLLIVATFVWSFLGALEDMAIAKNTKNIISQLTYPPIF